MTDPTLAAQIEALAPCPFCGGRDPRFVEEGERFYIACQSVECFCALGEGYDRDAMSDHCFPTAEHAIAAWNTRPAIVTALRQAEDEVALPHQPSISLERTLDFVRAGDERNWTGAIYDHLRNYAAILANRPDHSLKQAGVKQPCDRCGKPVEVNAVSPSECFCSAECADPEERPQAEAAPREWPDIGPDPLKAERPADRYEASRLAVREAYVKQQPYVPDQTALVWRWHIGTLLEMALRLQTLLKRDEPAQADAAPEPFGYWIEQRHAEPALLRKPAYIPEPSDLCTVTPLYAQPNTEAAPGVVEALERVLSATTLRALRGRDHVPSMREEQDACSQARAALALARQHGAREGRQDSGGDNDPA